jgi:hypothetical protein
MSIKNFKNIVIIWTALLCTSAFSIHRVHAQSASPSVSGSSTPKQLNRLDLIKDSGNVAIDLRIASLNKVTNKLNNVKKLKTEKKNQLNNQVQLNLTGLTALKSKLNSETEINAAQTDRQGIYTGFRIYAVFIPKTHILIATDGVNATAAKLTEVSDKLKSAIDKAQKDGKDVTEANTLLSEMNVKIKAAKSKVSTTDSKVSGLTPTSYPGSSSVLQIARDDIKSATAELKSAWENAKKIKNILKG